MRKRLLMFLAIVAESGILVAQSPAERMPVPPQTTRNFSREGTPLLFPNGSSIYRMLKPENFKNFRQEVLKLLSENDEMPSMGIQTSFPVWGSLYAGLVDNGLKMHDVSADSFLYVFGLICAGQLIRAEDKGVELLKKEPGNFGLLVLVGALAERNMELFPYLEQAIAENTTKTVEILNTLSYLRLISLNRNDQFLDRYLHQLYLHREEIQRKKIAKWTANRLIQIIYLQRKRQGKEKKQDPQTATLRDILLRAARESSPSLGKTIQIQSFRDGKLVRDISQPKEVERLRRLEEERVLRQEN